MKTNHPVIVDEAAIARLLAESPNFDAGRFEAILQRAGTMKGLPIEDVAFLLAVQDAEAIGRLTDLAVRIKEAIYGRRLVLFAPLYTSSFCQNDCLYCGFRSCSATGRQRLSLEAVGHEAEAIINMGHKRILMVAGEDPHLTAADLAAQVEAIYAVKLPKGSIRRVNVNVAPQETEAFRLLKAAAIGTYQCFQETYHRETYARMHRRGPKADYDYRVQVFDRCIPAGIDDFGMGILFGLFDCRFEVLAMFQHIAWLEKTFGIGPHTLSIPRLEPAEGTDVYETTPWRVTDQDLVKITAILRLAVPYTGIILSTRESAAMRERLLQVGVSQMSAGSITNPGGYAEGSDAVSQFHVQDHRSLDEVIREACRNRYLPSFCTGCYRQGRTGEHFQTLAKGHAIGSFCTVNAVATLQEYLEDFASRETREAGEQALQRFIDGQTDPAVKRQLEEWRNRIKRGERDIIW